jgi:hypothetical protein
MKVVRKGFLSPMLSANLWTIPTFTYIIQKVCGITFHREWVWWVGIPTMFLVWVLINWKITKSND